jgi:hypothetical protein
MKIIFKRGFLAAHLHMESKKIFSKGSSVLKKVLITPVLISRIRLVPTITAEMKGGSSG